MQKEKRDFGYAAPGTHAFTRGPQVILDSNKQVVARANTLTQARRIRKAGQRIVSAHNYETQK